MSVLAIDIGSSRIKALLADWDGRVIATRSTGTPRQSLEPGESAYPVDAVFAALEGMIVTLAAGRGVDPVDTLVFSCLGTAMAPLDPDGRPLGPALAPADARPGSTPGLMSSLGLDSSQLLAWTGSDPAMSSFLLHTLWWARVHPEVMDKVNRFRSLRGYAMARLCGADVEDRSWVSRTMLVDLETDTWSETILAAAGLSRDLFPAIAPPTATFPVRTDVIERLGLARGAVAVLGGMDNGCSLFGSDGPDRSGLVNIVGTYEHMAGAADLGTVRRVAAASGALIHAYILPGQYITMTREPVGGLLARVAAGHPGGLDALLEDVSTTPTGSAMPLDADAIDAAIGAGAPRREILQAVIESATAVLRRFVQVWADLGMPATPIVVVGGGSASEAVLRLKAAILARPLVTLATDQGSGLGALRIAAMAVRGATPAEACRIFANPITRIVQPPATVAAGAGGEPVR